jgi:cytochrome c oxidase subunit 1
MTAAPVGTGRGNTVQDADLRTVHRLTAAYLAVALSSLAIANIPSVFQALDRAGINLYPGLFPVIQSYYQGLTIHGVMNALVFTTFFICGFLNFIVVHSLRRPLAQLRLGWMTFWVMTAGLLLAVWPVLTNQASVLYTFYPPLKAHWAFYVGLTLVVAGTWAVTASQVLTWRAWRRANPEARTPLAAFGSLITMVMWTIASLGVAVEMVALLIPWSLGLVDTVDPLLARTLFWFTGHPIVYFWLLPAYVSWYTIVPRMVGGRLYSEPMARVAFLLFLLYSIPVGLHHQFSDPGIGGGIKLVHTFLTFAVFFPSLLTYFNIGATLESAGRARGGAGWFGWVRELPWGNPALTAQIMAMFLFVPGGIGGLINASYEVNQAVHNTSWVVGHFHLTVGSASTLTFMGTTYWLVPYLSGKALWNRRVALAQSILWFIGMVIWSETMHRVGLLEYIPRRTQLSAAPYFAGEVSLALILIAVGGVILFISGILYFLNIVLTLTISKEPANVEVPLAEAGEEGSHEHVPALLDRWRPWLVGATALILLAYLPVFAHLLTSMSSVVGWSGIW